MIQRCWKLEDRSIKAADILKLVREEGAVIFFDGLDEKIVHMPPQHGRAFAQTLWSTLPDLNCSAEVGVRRGKVLISCRSHYFPTIADQNALLSGNDREGFDKATFPLFCLLPFTEYQIRNYLVSFHSHRVPDPAHAKERANEAYTLIESIHNLKELAERPYLLSQIVQHLSELERMSMRGETVNAARLYQVFIDSWLTRDGEQASARPKPQNAC